LNASSPTQPKPVAPTVTARFKSALARLIGAKPVDKSGNSEPTPTATVAETIWSAQWCAQEPELASMAIATLQDRVQTLEDHIRVQSWLVEKNRILGKKSSRVVMGVPLSTVPPNTRITLLRTGEFYRTEKHRNWVFNLTTNQSEYFHGNHRVLILSDKPD
jgi:hypothetical protein